MTKTLPRSCMMFAMLLLWQAITTFAYGQQKKYSFNWENVALSSVFKQIEQAANVRFSYNPSGIKENTPIHLRMNSQQLDAVVARLLPGHQFNYRITDNIGE